MRYALVGLACLAVGLAGGTGLGWWARGYGTTASVAETAGRGVPAGPGGAVAKVAGHPFWKVKVTPAMVEDLCEKIRAKDQKSAVWIDDTFKTVLVDHKAGTPDPFANGTAVIGKRHVGLEMFKLFPSRPSREQVAEALLVAISKREYEG